MCCVFGEVARGPAQPEWRRGLDHKGLEGSLGMIELGRKPRILRGSCKPCLAVVEQGSGPSCPLVEPLAGRLGPGPTLPRDLSKPEGTRVCTGQPEVCLHLPRSQAAGSPPRQHLRHSFLFREERRGKGLQGRAPLGIWRCHLGMSSPLKARDGEGRVKGPGQAARVGSPSQLRSNGS